MWLLLVQYARNFLKWGDLEMLPLQGKVPFSALEDVRADWGDPWFEHQRNRYLQHQIFRKDLVAHYPVLQAWGLVMTQHALAEWYAKARAHLRESRDVEREDLNEAIRHVETYYSHHFTFSKVFAQMPALWGFIERLIEKHRFPYIITSEP